MKTITAKIEIDWQVTVNGKPVNVEPAADFVVVVKRLVVNEVEVIETKQTE